MCLFRLIDIYKLIANLNIYKFCNSTIFTLAFIRSATRILLREEFQMENFCDVILLSIFGDEIFMSHKNDVMCDFLKFYLVIISFQDHTWAKSRIFRSLKHKTKTIQNSSFFITLTWLREGLHPP